MRSGIKLFVRRKVVAVNLASGLARCIGEKQRRIAVGCAEFDNYLCTSRDDQRMEETSNILTHRQQKFIPPREQGPGFFRSPKLIFSLNALGVFRQNLIELCVHHSPSVGGGNRVA